MSKKALNLTILYLIRKNFIGITKQLTYCQ